jgi:predicted DNA-binding transcriptional regulator AlpA
MIKDSDELLSSKQVRQLLGGCSDMHVHRLCHSPKYAHLDFPKPVKFDDRPNARNYWWRSVIAAWIKRRLEVTAGGTLLPPTVVAAKRKRAASPVEA